MRSPLIRTRALLTVGITALALAVPAVTVAHASPARQHPTTHASNRHRPAQPKQLTPAQRAAQVIEAHAGQRRPTAIDSHGKVVPLDTIGKAVPRTQVHKLNLSALPATTGFGTISGTVHVTGGITPDQICAQAYTSDTFDWVAAQCASAVDGTYTIDVPVGSYVVGFDTSTCCSPIEFYNGKFSFQTADVVSVNDSADTPNIDISFGSISGTVTEAVTNTQLDNICANVFKASDVSRFSSIAAGCTDATGHYSVPMLTTGTYVVEFVDSKGPHVDTWYNGKLSGQDADFVSVTAGANTANIDTQMTVGGQITGHATDAVTSDPIQDVCVYVYDANTSDQIGDARCTDEFGSYITGGLPVGDYRLLFQVYDGTHVPQWYSGASSFDNATNVHVTAGSPAAADVALVTGHTISGTVTDVLTGDPIESAYVQVLTAAGDYIGFGYRFTDSDGTYTTPALLAGTYVVYIGAPYGSKYASQYYNNKPDFASADAVVVSGSADTTGVNGALASGGTISGTITDAATHDPIANVCVDIENADFSASGYACTDGAGHYTTSGVPTDDYTVAASNYYGPYLSAIYGVDAGHPDGTPVSVTTGSDSPGIDFALTRGAQFSGTITDAVTGVPLSNICVDVYQPATDAYYSYYNNCTGADGTYHSAGVPTGDFDLQFSNYGGRYVQQWYVNAPDQASATPIHANVGVDVTGVNVAMVLGGAVSGTITDATANPLSDICVTLYLPDGNFGGDGGCTDGTGKYMSAEVAPGSYKVGFYDPSNAYNSLYYNNKPDLLTADTIIVTAGATTSGIDAALTQATGGELSGDVEDVDGNDQSGSYVQACNPDLIKTGGGCRWTINNFGFDFSNLPAGPYTVTAFAPAGSDLLPSTKAATVDIGGFTSIGFILKAPTPLPAGSAITDGNGAVVGGPGSVPTLQWQDSYGVQFTGCAGGTGTLTITAKDAYTGNPTVIHVALTESPVGTGNYIGTVPELYPVYGQSTFAWTFTCGAVTTNGKATVYIDPSGTVEDQDSHPLSGATVTLLRSDSDSPAGPFLAVENGSETMSPSNRTNPMLSAADGSYGWDVVAGYYKVKATRDGCSTETSNVLTIPPAVTALTIHLQCGAGIDITAPTESIDTHPVALTKSRSAAFGFSGSDSDSPPVTFTCSLDGGAVSPCSTGQGYTSLADGLHTFAVVAHDNAGNFSLPSTFEWRVDATKPSVKFTAPTAPFTTATSVTLKWTGTDKGAGVDHYQLRYRRAAYSGNFPTTWTTPTSWKSVKALKISSAVSAGYDYCYEIRATDKAGNTSAWTSAKCIARLLDDRALTASRGWTRGKGAAYYLGTVSSATTKNATLTKNSVVLDRIGVLVTKCKGCGSIGVFVGTKQIGTINLSATKTLTRVLVTFAKFSLRTAKVTLKVLSTGKKVLVDGVALSRT